jgi:N-carbamoyl-L-amino-acid hydrolase
MPKINAERLIADLHTLRGFGSARERGFDHPTRDQVTREVDGGLPPAPTAHGVVRPTFTAADMASRRWLRAKFEEAGLISVIDGVANVIGRSRNEGPALLVGSHSDTQPRGGWLDGAMGVIYGLECARALAEDPETAHLAVDCASWADEETVYLNMLGSRSFIGALSQLDSELGGWVHLSSQLLHPTHSAD